MNIKADLSTIKKIGFNSRGDQIVTVDVSLKDGPAINLKAILYADGSISLSGFTGHYLKGEKIWPAFVLLKKNGEFHSASFGRDDRGNFNKSRNLTLDPKTFFSVASKETWALVENPSPVVEQKAEATKGPIHQGDHPVTELVLYRADGYAIADAKVWHGKISREEALANAAKIERSWNSYEALVSALKAARSHIDATQGSYPGLLLDQIDASLKLAGVEV